MFRVNISQGTISTHKSFPTREEAKRFVVSFNCDQTLRDHYKYGSKILWVLEKDLVAELVEVKQVVKKADFGILFQ